jgi:F-box and WD-40 domain protein 7
MIQLVKGHGNAVIQQRFPTWEVPLGVALRIFSQADPESVCSCNGVCRAWHLAFRDDGGLRELLQRCFLAADLLRSNLTRGVCSMEIFVEHTKDITSLTIAGGRLFSGSADCTIKISSWEDYSCSVLYGHKGTVLCLVVEGDRLFSGSRDTTIKVWDLKNKTCAATLEGHVGAVHSLVVAGGKLFSVSEDKTIKVWEKNVCIATLTGHTQNVKSLVAAQDKLFSGSYDKTIKVWDVRSHACIDTLTGHRDSICSLAVGENELFSGSWDGEIKIWDLKSRTCTATLAEPGRVPSLAIRGDKLFVASHDFAIRIWDLESRTRIASLFGHKCWVNSLAIEGTKLFSGSGDGVIMVRDFAASHNQVLKEIADGFESRNERLTDLAFGRLNNMPEEIKSGVFKELDQLFGAESEQKDLEHWKKIGFTKSWYSASPWQRTQAVRSYLKRLSLEGKNL